MKYTCPKCNEGFDKPIGNKCPNCHVALKSGRRFENGKLAGWYYKLANQADALVDTRQMVREEFSQKEPDITITSESPEKLSSKYPIRLSEPGQLPVVIQAGENEFDVYFQHMMYTGMIYCPKCQSPAFQNMQLFGDLEHWCAERFDGKSCKARTTYHFNDPVGVEVNQSLTTF